MMIVWKKQRMEYFGIHYTTSDIRWLIVRSDRKINNAWCYYPKNVHHFSFLNEQDIPQARKNCLRGGNMKFWKTKVCL